VGMIASFRVFVTKHVRIFAGDGVAMFC